MRTVSILELHVRTRISINLPTVKFDYRQLHKHEDRLHKHEDSTHTPVNQFTQLQIRIY